MKKLNLTLLIWACFSVMSFAQNLTFTTNLTTDKGTVCKGKSVKFSTQVNNASYIEFQRHIPDTDDWIKISSENINSQIKDVEISLYDLTENTTLRALIKNSTDSIYSNPHTVLVQWPEIQLHPIDLTQCNGGEAIFRVHASQLEKYQWQQSTNNGSTFTDLTETTKFRNIDSPNLTVKDIINSHHNTLFRVKLEDNLGCVEYSNPATLFVNQLSTAISPTTTNPFCEGDTVSFFPASVTGEALEYQWQHKKTGQNTYSDLPLSDLYTGYNTVKLNVNGVFPEENSYRIVIHFSNLLQNADGSSEASTCFLTSTRTNYKILPRPQKPSPINTVERCGPGSLIIEANEEVYWYKDSSLSRNTTKSLSFKTDTLISYTPFYFTTKDLNGCESYKQEVIAKVNPIPYLSLKPIAAVCPSEDFITLIPDSVSYAENIKVYPSSTFQVSPEIKIPKGDLTHSTTHQLKFQALNSHCSSDTLTYDFRIKTPTIIQSEFTNTSLCIGDSFILSPDFIAEEPYSFKWTKNNDLISENNTLSIPIESTEQNGTYSLTLEGACGTETKILSQLLVSDKTQITKQPQDIIACEGSDQLFTITAAGPGTINYQWYVNNEPAGSNSDSLIISNISAQLDQASIFCKVSSACQNDAISNEVRLSVVELPAIPSLADTLSFCTSSSVLNLTENLNGLSTVWYNENKLPFNSHQVNTFEIADKTIFVKHKNLTNCESDFKPVHIKISPSFDISVFSNQTTICQSGLFNRETELATIYPISEESAEFKLYRNNNFISENTLGTFKVTEAGLYRIEATKGFCSSSDTISIHSPNELALQTPQNIDLEICKGGNLTVYPESNNTNGQYIWWNDTSQYSFFAAGDSLNLSNLLENTSYYVSYSKELNETFCESERAVVNIKISDSIQATVDITPPTCNTAGAALISVQNGSAPFLFILNDTLQNTTGFFDNLQPNLYTVNIKDRSGCNITNSFSIENTAYSEIKVQPSDASVCNGNIANISITASNYDALIWQKKLPDSDEFISLDTETTSNLRITNSGNANNPHNTLYRVILYKDGCETQSQEARLLVNSVSGTNTSVSACLGDTLKLNLETFSIIGNIKEKQWQFRAGTSGSFINLENDTSSVLFKTNLQESDAGYYRGRLVFQNLNGSTCVINTPGNGIRLTLTTPQTPVITGADTVCTNQIITLKVENCTGTIIWSDNVQGNTNTIQLAETSTYTASCQTGNCITQSVPFTVVVKEGMSSPPTIIANKENYCYGDSIQLEASQCDGIVNWSNGLTGSVIEFVAESTQAIFATCSNNLCTSSPSDTLTLTIQPKLIAGTIQENIGVFCAGYNPPNITSSLNANTTNIQWQYSNTCENDFLWEDINGATSQTYNPPALQATTCYRRMVWSDCDTLFSNVVTIHVNPDPILSLEPLKSTICPEEDLLINSKLIGGAGICEIQWQINKVSASASNPNWQDLTQGDTLKYTFTNKGSDSTFHFRARVSCDIGSCNNFTSSSTSILFLAKPKLLLNVANDTTVCSGSLLTIEAKECFADFKWSNGETTKVLNLNPTEDTTIQAICSNTCSSVAQNINIKVKPGISPPINSTPDTTFTPESLTFSATGQSLKWFSSESSTNHLQNAPNFTTAGTYTIWVSQTIENCESPRLKITATLLNKLNIISQPTDVISCYGNVSTLTLTTNGGGNISYKWQRKLPEENTFTDITNNSHITRENTNSLRIASTGNIQSPDKTVFRCIVSDGFGEIISEEITVSVNRIQGSLPNQNLCIGDNLTLDLSKSHTITGEPSVIQWQHRPGTGHTWTSLQDTAGIKGSSDFQLNLGTLDPINQVQLRCSVVFKSTSGTCTINSDLMTLKVGTIPPQPSPLGTEICQGTTLPKFSVYPPENTTVVWYRGFQDTPLRSQPSFSSNEPGDHFMHYSYKNNLGCESPKTPIHIIVHSKPATPINTTPAIYDESESLTFSAIGEDLKWYRTKTLKAFELYPPTFNTTGKKSYYVTQTNAKGCESERLQIQSEIKAVFSITTQPQNSSNCDGNIVTFSVRVKGGTNPTYQWQRENEGLFLNIPGENANNLRITNSGTAPNLEGSRYRCLINSGGKVLISNIASLHINSLKSVLPEINLCEGEPLNLVHYKDSLTGIINQIEWQKRVGSSYSTLFTSTDITTTFPSDSLESGSYRLRVNFHNLGGGSCVRNSNLIRLNISPKPEKPVITDLKLCEGNSLSDFSKNIYFLNADSTDVNLNLTFEADKDYQFLAYSLSSFGCKSNYATLKTTSLSKPQFNAIGSDTTICQFSKNTLNLTNVKMLWYNDLDSLISPLLTINTQEIESHLRTYRLEAENGCMSEKRQIKIHVNPCYLPGKNDTCLTQNYTQLNRNDWNYFYNESGEIYAAIHPNGNNLGRTFINHRTVSSKQLKEFYPREWTLQTAREIPASKVQIRLFISAQEVQDFQVNANNSLAILRRDILHTSCQWPSDSSTLWLNSSEIWQDTDDLHYKFVEFETDKNGTFLLWHDLAPTGNLHVELNQNQMPELSIRNYADLPIGNYRIYKSESGQNWIDWATVHNPYNSVEDPNPYLYQNYYQLIYDFNNSVKAILDEKHIELPEKYAHCAVLNNPITDKNQLSVYFPNADKNKVHVITALGNTIPLQSVTEAGNHFTIKPVNPLPSGIYILKMENSFLASCTKRIIVP